MGRIFPGQGWGPKGGAARLLSAALDSQQGSSLQTQSLRNNQTPPPPACILLDLAWILLITWELWM